MYRPCAPTIARHVVQTPVLGSEGGLHWRGSLAAKEARSHSRRLSIHFTSSTSINRDVREQHNSVLNRDNACGSAATDKQHGTKARGEAQGRVPPRGLAFWAVFYH